MNAAQLFENVKPDQLYRLSGDIRRLADVLTPACEAKLAVTAELVRSIIRARKLREEYFGAGLFADPGWDMLLDLLWARLEGRRVAVSSLCIAAAVPSTTALRWIKTLESRSLIERQRDPSDGRRVYVQLTEQAADQLIQFLTVAQGTSHQVM